VIQQSASIPSNTSNTIITQEGSGIALNAGSNWVADCNPLAALPWQQQCSLAAAFRMPSWLATTPARGSTCVQAFLRHIKHTQQQQQQSEMSVSGT
jgi:hypothetical protein